MLRTGRKNNQVQHPLLLDPVGAGASRRRCEVLEMLLTQIQFSAIRGNISEIKFVGDVSLLFPRFSVNPTLALPPKTWYHW